MRVVGGLNVNKQWLFGALAGLISFCLVACGTGGGTLDLQVGNGATGTQNKQLFSLWTESGNLYKIDLTNSAFGVSSSVTLTAITGQDCICQVLIQGTNASGLASFTACAGSYPNCSSFNSTGGSASYTNNGTTLQICPSVNNCDTFN